MSDVSVWGMVALGAAAFIVGLAKTAVPGASTLAVAIFATVLPARTSTATLLLLLIVGDVMALALYRRHADVKSLVKLAPAVAAGLLVGAVFLVAADDSWVRRTIGVILLSLIAFTLWLRRRARTGRAVAPHGAALALGYGSLGGFTTMVANAGGPVMSMYFLASGFAVKTFLGTSAWFFAIVNIVKVPIAAGIGLITPNTLLLDALLAPLVLLGGLAGWLLAGRFSQSMFERIVVILTIVGATYLLV